MLAMADRNGVVECTIPGLADRARITVEQCETGLARFQMPDKYSWSKEEEGRRVIPVEGGWFLINHAKYRALLSKDEQREKTRIRVARWRGNNKPLRAVTGVTGNESNDIASTSTSTKAKVQKQPSVTTESFSLDAATSYVLIETKLAGRNIRDVVHEVLQNESGDKKAVAEKLISAWAAYCQAKPKYKQSPENFFARGTWRDPTSWSEDKTAKRADGWLPPQNVADDYVPESVKRRKEIEAAKAAGL